MLLPIAGRRIYYDLLGPRDAEVVCFLNSLASDGGMWAEQVPAVLAAGYLVLRIDMRGHGGSDPVAGAYTTSGLADDVIAVLDFLGIDRVHIVGLSIGGIIGQAVAIRLGNRVRSLMLCDTAGRTPAHWPEAWAQRIALVTAAGSVEPLADSTIQRWLTDAYRADNPARWKEVRATIAAITLDGYLGAAASLLDFDFTGDLPSLRVPTLVVCGEHDEGTPPAINREIAALIPGARYVEIANARHLPNIEHPGVFNRILTGWLKGIS